ncbi:class I SAM-dependent methyltransferase [Streptacidiphilus neutrinimicus]|uniref:class I SAM-dependent methyltransferase n=1 Tax=Streptacidiphilus neutrinimicus TaxID=105420 RepID=UPI000A57AF5C|nr:class I SAM-dependent methyltransferase [Streptacidiphilus neutrinimicus]
MAQAHERALVFGTTAEAYDAARPSYPDALVDTVLAYAGGAGPGALRAVEIGAGTGKATAVFGGRGLPVLAVEPDPRMAEVLRRKLDSLPHVEIEVSRFEQWQPGARRFDLAYAAQAWHWLDRETRRDRIFDALAPGGAVALFWNLLGIVDPVVHRDLTAFDTAYGSGLLRVTGLASDFAGEIESTEENGWAGWEFGADVRFTDQRSVRLRNGVTRRSADSWLAAVATYSGVQIMEPERRAEFLAELRSCLDAHGGFLDIAWFTDLFVARRVPVEAGA